MKKILAVTLVLVMCFSLSVTAFAAGGDGSEPVDYDVSLTVYDAGGTITVTLDANTAVTDGWITIAYDTAAVSVAANDVVATDAVTLSSVNAETAGTVVLSWLSGEAAEGKLFDLGFAAKGGAELGSGTFSVDGYAVTEDGEEVSVGLTTVVTATEDNPTTAVDKTLLEALYASCLGLEESDYTAESWAALVDAMNLAQAVLNDGYATQEDVDAAVSALIDALTALVAVETPAGETEEADKSVLQALYDSAQDLDESVYTSDSWKALQRALSTAQTVLENPDATQEEIDAAVAALTDAISGLVTLAQAAEGSGEGTEGTTSGAGTGDQAPVLLISVTAVVVLAALAAVATLLLRRRNATR